MKIITLAIHKVTKRMVEGSKGQLSMSSKASFARSIGQTGVKRTEYDLVEVVAVPVDDFKEIQRELEFLSCLRSAGVDNWEGYSDAYAMMEEEEN